MGADKTLAHVNQIVDLMDVDQECAAVDAKLMCKCVVFVALFPCRQKSLR